MSSRKCVRCGLFWSFNSGENLDYVAITRWCPLCVAVVFPIMGGLLGVTA